MNTKKNIPPSTGKKYFAPFEPLSLYHCCCCMYTVFCFLPYRWSIYTDDMTWRWWMTTAFRTTGHWTKLWRRTWLLLLIQDRIYKKLNSWNIFFVKCNYSVTFYVFSLQSPLIKTFFMCVAFWQRDTWKSFWFWIKVIRVITIWFPPGSSSSIYSVMFFYNWLHSRLEMKCRKKTKL